MQKDLKDIRQKISRILGKDLDKSDNLLVEAVGPVKRIEGSVLVDFCMQRSGKRGSGCDTPKSADRFPKSSEGFPKASEGFPIPVTSPPRPPTPPAAQMRQYSWRNFVRKEVCLYIRTLKPSKTSKEEGKLKGKQLKEFIVEDLHQNREKTMTSLWLSRLKSGRDNQPYSVILDDTERRNTEIGHVSPYENDKC